ncbi:HutD family protein [Oceanimonas pelagia]|uniref:HutD family protein n=1 Tax=Oceanimonas pelagia TaxID=3028314 RepID=A0AA50QB18_9GAMM|nr:HutD family protein [Oceanimonas pelagia]WMC09787.1 HutD family protein [Oceanimonas pelagia]
MATLLTSAHFTDMPWKNGGGTTCELLRLPAEGDFAVRLSTARVGQNGPFSCFPGIDRVLMLLEGDGVELAMASGTRVLKRPFEPIAFSGDEPVHCRLLNGECLDFNLMTRRDWGRATLEVLPLRAGDACFSQAPQARLLYLHGGEPRLWIVAPDEAFSLTAEHDGVLVDITLYPDAESDHVALC